MCSRHACVRATEYRKRIQVAKAHRRRYLGPDKTIRRAMDESDDSDCDSPLKFVYPMKFKRVLKFKWRERLFSLGNFRRLSIQQVVENARDTNDPFFELKSPLNPSIVLGYMRDNGVTFEKYYPTIEGVEELETESKEETETEHAEGDVRSDSETDKFHEKTNVELWNIGAPAERGKSIESESHAEGSLYGENYEGECHEAESEAESHAEGSLYGENYEGECHEAESEAESEAETSSSVWESEGKAKTWQVQKRLYIKGFTTLYLEHGKLEKFVKLIVHHCRKGGPVIGLVTCCEKFDVRFQSKKGYDFIPKIKMGGNVNGLMMVDDVEEDDTCSTDSSVMGVAGHCVTIIGYGTMRRRLVWSRLRRQGWKNKRAFFLVQDSSGGDTGAFRNGLAIVFASSFSVVHVPYF